MIEILGMFAAACFFRRQSHGNGQCKDEALFICLWVSSVCALLLLPNFFFARVCLRPPARGIPVAFLA